MGERGPVPNRSDQRRRRNKPETPVSTAPATGSERQPPDESWHQIARDWYESFSRSGQSRFFEPSDWATARYVAEAMSRSLAGTKMSGQLFASVMSASSLLLATEGDRRRLRIELERASAEGEDDGVVTELAQYRRRAAG